MDEIEQKDGGLKGSIHLIFISYKCMHTISKHNIFNITLKVPETKIAEFANSVDLDEVI